MKKFLKTIITSGLTHAKNPTDVKNITLMNRMSLIMAVLMVLFGLISPILKLYDILYFSIPFTFAFGLTPYFNYKGWLSFNKYYFTIVPIFFVCLVCWHNSIGLGDRYFFFATALIPLILFKNRVIIFALSYLNMGAFFFVSWYQNNYKPYATVPHDAEGQYWVISIMAVFTIFYFVIQYLKKGSDDYEHEIEEKNELISYKNKEIVDSINYAKKIQNALLAHNDFLNKYLPEHFIFFKPKDIVSGDFYWATETENKFYLAVCDSTGHGVPGAFMSLLNIGFLNEGIIEKNIHQPNQIFNHVRNRLIESISKEGQQDGMDGILLKLETINSKLTIEYAAANNAPILIRNNEVIILPHDKMPVGKGEKQDSFKLQNIDILKGDYLYLYTDGFADQFGGPKGKKYKYKALNELILQHHQKPFIEQKRIFETNFENWKGNLEQVDDVCIIGIKL